MKTRLLVLILVSFLVHSWAKNPPPTTKGENEDLTLTATLYADPAEIKELIGSDLGGHYIVASVKVEPKYGKDIALDRDDFQLRTDKDGEKSRPYAPSQIAGSGSLVIREVKGEGAASPGWTGMGGPVIVGGGGAPASGGVIGNSAGGVEGAQATVQKDEKPNPLKKTLEEKILPEGKTTDPVSGLLFFPMEKQKIKNLELTYGGTENKISLRFK
jgi:hypothetical protein